VAIKLFELGFVLKAIDQLSPVLKRVEAHVQQVNERAKAGAGLREYAGNLAMVGAGAVAAGGALGYALYSSVKAAAEMQGEMAHVSTAMADGAATAQHLAEAHKMANEVAAHSVIGNKELAESYYMARSNMLGHKEALEAVRATNLLVMGTSRDAAAAQASMVETTRTLSTLMHNFGGSAQHYSDILAKLQTQYAEANISEVTFGLEYAMPVMKRAGITIGEAGAALAKLSASGLHGEQAGTAFQEMVSKFLTGDKLLPFVRKTKQGGLDLAASLGALHDAFGGLAPVERARQLHELGFNMRDIQGVSLMIDSVKEYSGVVADLVHSEGAAAHAAALRSAAADYQWAMLANNVSLLKEAFGDALLPAVNAIAKALIPVLQGMAKWAEANKGWVKFGAEAAAIASAVLLVGGGLALAGAALAGFASVVPVIVAIGAALATPVGWAIALATAAMLIYRNFATIKNFVLSIDWKGVGLAILKGIGAGLLAGASYLLGPLRYVGKIIADHFVGHSPPPLGPLRHLNQVRIVQTIADTIRPAPVFAAVSRVAAAAALVVPIAIGGAASAARGTGGGMGGGVNVTINITGSVGDVDGLRTMLEAHGHEILESINREQDRRARREF
jgi:Phage-related minor tail protein